MDYYRVLGPLLRALPAETAHGAAIAALKSGAVPPQPVEAFPELRTRVMGIDFSNPVGMAAGFDKNAELPGALFCQGFGFVECGTVTPRPQPGNPRPRMFRLNEDRAVINRLGFNSGGMEAFRRNIASLKDRAGVIGINIGKNKTSDDAIADYTSLLQHLYPLADYIAVNISSPNTPGLRDLQGREALRALVRALHAAREDLARRHEKRVPIAVKIAPDITRRDQEDIAEVAMAAGLDALIIANTTLSRPDALQSIYKKEQGGLSGAPLFALSTELLANMHRLTKGSIPLIGVGGISSAEDAYAKIKAGASLVQLYSALVYEGFGLVTRIKRGVRDALRRDGFASIRQAVGVDTR